MREDLKGILEGIVDELEEKGIDLEATPALFSWYYPDNDEINYQILIKKEKQTDLASFVEGTSSVH